MTELPLTGGCGCGAVRFEVSAPLEDASYCHCTRCQRRSGTAASAQARVAPGALRMVSGAERIRYWAPPGGFEKGFCGECGSHLGSRPPGTGELTSLRLGAFDGDPGVRPSYRHHVATAVAWEPIPDDGLPRHDDAP